MNLTKFRVTPIGLQLLFSDIADLLNPIRDGIKYYRQHKAGWIVQDSEGYSAIGMTREQAIENYSQLLDRKVAVLSEKVERDRAEMKRRHRELWNY